MRGLLGLLTTVSLLVAVGLPVGTHAALPAPALAAQAQAALPGQRPDPQEQLDKLRKALIDAATSANSRVQSLSFIDSQGRLYEAARFQSDVTVRWSGSDNRRQAALLQVSGAAACNPQLRFKRHARLVVAPGQPGEFFGWTSLRVLSSRLTPDIMAALAAESGWLVTQALANEGSGTAYERALTRRPADLTPFRVELRLDDRGVFLLPRPRRASPWVIDPTELLVDDSAQRLRGRLGIELTLLDQSGRQLLRESAELVFRREARLPGSLPDFVLDDPAAAQAALMRLQSSLKGYLACEPPDYPIVDASGAGRRALRLGAGRAVGLTVGDRLLLSSARGWSGLALNPGLIPQLAVVEVQSVSDYSADISVVAGPTPSGAGPYFASPL